MSPEASPVGEAETTRVTGAGEGERRTGWHGLLAATSTWIFLVLLVIIAIFSILNFEAFASVFNLRNIMIDASSLLIIAVGMTFVIVTGGIDLSVGSVLVFSQVVAALVMRKMGGEGLPAILGGLGSSLLSGLVWGLLNGLLIARTRIPALIVTLGTLGMAQGSALLLSGGINVRGVPRELVTTVGIGRVWDTIPYLVLIAAGITILAGILLHLTRFGRYTYAIGSNAEASRRAGINVSLHLVKVYAMSGLLAGVAGYLQLARFTTTTIEGHGTANLQAIAAVVIGGTSLFGGTGAVFGTVVGVFIPAILRNGFIIGVSPFWQQVAVGAVLILAVYVDQVKRRARQRK